MVGTSGASGERLAVDTASARSRPAAACGRRPDVEPNDTLNWPARKSATIAEAPRYGKGTVSNPASSRKYSMTRCEDVPLPPCAYAIGPSFLAQATNSATLLTGTEGCTNNV